MEERAAAIIRQEVPGLFMTLSHEIGRIGLLERENAAIMNACLADLAEGIVKSFRDALGRLHIDAPFYISQNDGTLMNAEKYPVLGTGGGGDPYLGTLVSLQALSRHGPMRLVTADELNDETLVVLPFTIGSPVPLIEKFPLGKEMVQAFETINRCLGGRVQAVMPNEIGGINSMVPFFIGQTRHHPADVVIASAPLVASDVDLKAEAVVARPRRLG